MSWEKKKFKELYAVNSKNGIYKSSQFHGSGTKIVNMGELFSYGFIGNQEMQRIVVSDKEKRAFGLKRGDLLFARRSLVESGAGKCSIVKNLSEPTVFESSLIRVRLNEKLCNPLFYYYWLQSHEGRAQISALVNGVNVKGIRSSALKEINVDLPKISVQNKIADFLYLYDDLIENNQKQIKLLEEAAQRLYKEWFVDLHFPGYEDVKIVDGVPEEWKKKSIDEVFQIKYGKTLPKTKITSSGKYPVYGANGVIGFYCEKNCEDYTVLITSRGNGSGKVLRTHDRESFVTNNSFIVKPIDSSMRIPFVHQLMKNTDFKSMRTGSAQPQLTNKSISMISLDIPNRETISKFCDKEMPWYEKVENLLKQNKLLAQARDRLLPKLMNGEIEV